MRTVSERAKIREMDVQEIEEYTQAIYKKALSENRGTTEEERRLLLYCRQNYESLMNIKPQSNSSKCCMGLFHQNNLKH